MNKQELKKWNVELMITGIEHKIENTKHRLKGRKIKMTMSLSQPVEILEEWKGAPFQNERILRLGERQCLKRFDNLLELMKDVSFQIQKHIMQIK